MDRHTWVGARDTCVSKKPGQVNLNVGVWQGEEVRTLGSWLLAGFHLLRLLRCIRCCYGFEDNPLCVAHTPAAWMGEVETISNPIKN